MQPEPPLHISGGRVVRDGRTEPATVVIAGRHIERIDPTDPTDPADPVGRSDGTKRIDGTGLLIAPGFIDLQINGGFGFDLFSAPETMWDLARSLPQHGVTSFLPTIITGPPTASDRALDALARRPVDHRGAEPLGLHLEGPMLNPARRGAHPERHLVAPSDELAAGWSRAAGVAMVTIAPELPGARRVIEGLRSRGVVVADGHTAADHRQAAAAKSAGVTMVTHLFNAMEPLGHRNPNLVGFALADGDLTTGLIVDGVHVDPLVVATAWRAKGPDRLALVTDAVAAMGRPYGDFDFGRRSVRSDERGVRSDDGTLAGSNLRLDQAVRNLMAFTGCGPEQALQTVTGTPASVLSDRSRGRLSPGARADLVLLDDELTVLATIGGGRLLFVDPRAEALIGPGIDRP